MRDGELFAWEVTYIGQPVARWEYRLEPTGDAVKLIETVHDRRGRLLHAVSPLITGSPDRDERNADTMESTLQAIKAAAEAELQLIDATGIRPAQSPSPNVVSHLSQIRMLYRLASTATGAGCHSRVRHQRLATITERRRRPGRRRGRRRGRRCRSMSYGGRRGP